MPSRLTLAAAALAVLALTACGPTPAPTPTPSETPVVTSPTPTASAAPERAELVLPTCEELFTPDQVLELMGDSMSLNAPEDAGLGSQFENLRAILVADGSFNCTWVLPGSEYGVSVSILESSTESDTAVRETLTAAGSAGTSTGGDSVIFAIEGAETPERSAFVEAHYLVAGIWVCVKGGQGSPALAQAAMSRMAELNPTWFAVP